jgi:hypothetical protein
MTDRIDDRRSLDDEHVMLDRQLALLQHFSPASGFEDRVMAQVLTPAPSWLRALKRRGQALADTGRLWWLLGGLAVASMFSICVVSVVIALNAGAVTASLGDLYAQVGLPTWRAMLGVAVHTARGIYSMVNSATLSGQVIAAVLISLVLVLTSNAWILHRLLQPAPVERVKPDVAP